MTAASRAVPMPSPIVSARLRHELGESGDLFEDQTNLIM